ncbi:hypothetical protein ATJ93_1583 [Halopiger aswanensis]|uniref:Small CPxCG-related zinc finger protein n=1 Tax=Halopiger aswanensis TaxID=148449 RepID=A0A419WGT4_9EURY|nr:hypothetical protein ATJ93_1583 [Halopiger aswanensis]
MTTVLRTSTSRSTCLHCGSFVTDRFRRVYGDDADRAHRCSECDSYPRLSRGSAAGKEVEIPDPETSPGRHGGDSDR